MSEARKSGAGHGRQGDPGCAEAKTLPEVRPETPSPGTPAATPSPHELRLAWAFNDPGVVHLARYGTEETLCGKDALGVNIGRRSVTCVACKEQTL